MMDKFIHTLKFGASDHIFAYLDDFCVVTGTFEDHLYWLEIFLTGIRDANLEMNVEKSSFCCSSFKYLGYLVDYQGLHVDLNKIRSILNYPATKNLRLLRRFLGIVGWYARFSIGFAVLKVTLFAVLRKDEEWNWTQKHQSALDAIEEGLTTAPVLIRPDSSKPFELYCDASEFSIGAVLSQKIDGHQHSIVSVNRLLTSCERKYATTEKERLGVSWATEKLRPHLEGYSFKVFTDHSSPKWLSKIKNPTDRLARWTMSLLSHDIEIIHRPGGQSQVPDALSRSFEDSVCIVSEKKLADHWHKSKFKEVSDNSSKFPDFKIENGKSSCHHPD